MKKGDVEEIFSKAKYGDGSDKYKIFYRNFEKILETTLIEFTEISDNFQTIPVSRIERIERNNIILFEKNKIRTDQIGNS